MKHSAATAAATYGEIDLTRDALAVAVVYLLVGWLWIAASDSIGPSLFASIDSLTRFQTYKGQGFVLLTAITIFFLVRRAKAPAGAAAVADAFVPRRAGLSMSALLWLRFLCVLAPLLFVLGYHLHGHVRDDAQHARGEVSRTLLAAAATTSEHLKGKRRMVEMLAARSSLKEFRPDRCRALDGVAGKDWLAVATYDLGGRRVCSAGPDFEGPAAAALTTLAAGAEFAAHAPVRAAGATGEWVVPMTFAVRDSSHQMLGSIHVALRLDTLALLVQRAQPKDGLGGVLDAQGNVLVRTQDADKYVGQHVDTPVAQRMLAQRSGMLVDEGPDGVERIYAFSPLEPFGWTIAIGLPTDAVYGPARRAMGEIVLAVGAALVLALLLGQWLLSQVTRPMQRLQAAAEAVADGSFDRRVTVEGPTEVAQVGAAFNRMLDRLVDSQYALLESKTRYRLLADLAPDGILVQRAGAATYVNPRLRELLGLGADASEAVDVLALAHPDDRAVLEDRLGLLADHVGMFSTAHVRFVRPDGAELHVEHVGNSYMSHGVVVVQSHFLDVTERDSAARALRSTLERLEDTVARRTGELQAANAALQSFTFSVAHDLRSPLARIAGFAGALCSTLGQDAAKTLHYARRIEGNAQEMMRMIDGMLALARVERDDTCPEEFDTGSVVASLLEEMDVRPGTECCVAPLPVVRAQPILRQVWANLLSNALKYSSKSEHPRLEVGCRRLGAEFVFHVADNGAGFDPQEAPRLFGLFERLGTAREFDGNGVGLAIVKRIVERHGGRVWAEGRVGEGARFFFSLPADAAAP